MTNKNDTLHNAALHNAKEQAKDFADDVALAQLLNTAPKPPEVKELAETILAAALLDKATAAPASPQLAQNILAAANPQSTSHRSNVIAFERKSGTPYQRSKDTTPANTWRWPAAAAGVMAASLLLGIWTGTNGTLDPIISAPLELAGVTAQNSDPLSLYESIDAMGEQTSLQ